MKKKIVLYDEILYPAAIILLALAVAMVAAADFGVSMIVAPAYVLSLKLKFLTFGQAEYVVQSVLFVLLCVVMKKVRIAYFFSFFTCLVYGFVLDLWRKLIPALNPQITPAGSFSLIIRIVLFVFGMLLTAFSVALFFKIYLCPQVYDFFVRIVSKKYGIVTSRFKTCFDLSCLAVSAIMSFSLFHRLSGIGFGTVIMALFNGFIIGFFCQIFDKIFIFKPSFKNISEKFQ